MSMKITDECINCGACEYACPNKAILEAGRSFVNKNNEKCEPLSDDHFFIVPHLCNQCNGKDSECIKICPINCIKKTE